MKAWRQRMRMTKSFFILISFQGDAVFCEILFQSDDFRETLMAFYMISPWGKKLHGGKKFVFPWDRRFRLGSLQLICW